MPRLLAAEDAAVPVQSLEDVAVADVGRDHPDAAFLHEPVKAEIRHRRHGDDVDAEMQREDRDDLVAVDSRAVRVHREHTVTVAVERDAEVELPRGDSMLKRSEVGRTAADVDVRAVGHVADRLHVGAEP